MQVARWIVFTALIGYCGDLALYNGVHAQGALLLVRGVAHGIVLGLLRVV
jgi:hypothetical protein